MKCKKCGFEIPQNAKVCPQCGTKASGGFPAWAIAVLVIFGAGIFILPIIGIVAAMTIPTLVANTDSAKNRSQYKKDIATLNQALLMSEAQNGKLYSRADDVVNIAIKGSLSGAQDIPNGIVLADNSSFTYQKTGTPCKRPPAEPSAHTACAILTIDTNGFDKGPNKRTDKRPSGRYASQVNDQFRVLLYSTSVVPENGTPEYDILKGN